MDNFFLEYMLIYQENLHIKNQSSKIIIFQALKKITNLLLKNQHDPRQFSTEDGCIQISRHRIKHMFYIIVKDCTPKTKVWKIDIISIDSQCDLIIVKYKKEFLADKKIFHRPFFILVHANCVKLDSRVIYYWRINCELQIVDDTRTQ